MFSKQQPAFQYTSHVSLQAPSGHMWWVNSLNYLTKYVQSFIKLGTNIPYGNASHKFCHGHCNLLNDCLKQEYHIFTRGQFWPSGIVIACVRVCQSVCQSLACPRDNLGPIQARIAKFGPKMQKTLVKVPIVFGGQLTLTVKVKFNLKVRIYPILSLSTP